MFFKKYNLTVVRALKMLLLKKEATDKGNVLHNVVCQCKALLWYFLPQSVSSLSPIVFFSDSNLFIDGRTTGKHLGTFDATKGYFASSPWSNFVWIGEFMQNYRRRPNINTYFQPLVKSLEALQKNGYTNT